MISWRPVDRQKMVSPSNIECTGRIGPGQPVVGDAGELGALRLGQRRRSGHDADGRVERRRWCLGGHDQHAPRLDCGGRRSRDLLVESGSPVDGSMTRPAALTTASAATTMPSANVTLAVPTPPCRPTGLAPCRRRPCRSRRSSARAACRSAIAEVGVGAIGEHAASAEVDRSPPRERSAPRTGPRADGEADATLLEQRHDSDRLRRARRRCRPSGRCAWTCWTRFSRPDPAGRSRACPGPPPRTSTPATAPPSARARRSCRFASRGCRDGGARRGCRERR